MSISIGAITMDCDNAVELAAFWSAALDRPIDTGGPGASEFFASIGRDDPAGPGTAMMFIKVPESKTVKNRTHLDLTSDDPAAEVERLVGLGATVIHDKAEWGHEWTTLADPEGNEFCIAAH
ncbi:MAG: VOC family protein [Actinomycetota bacterium]